jgi:hypothetical protein
MGALVLYTQKLGFLRICKSSLNAAFKKISLLLFLLFAASYAYFMQDGGNPNVFCRAALAANLVQSGRVDINGYESHTIDIASHGGNFY